MKNLIIRNFGPIKDVEIELNKYLILIGDTSTGKSIIAKLIAIFKEIFIEGINDIKEFENKLYKYNIPFPIDNAYFEYDTLKIENHSLSKPIYPELNISQLADITLSKMKIINEEYNNYSNVIKTKVDKHQNYSDTIKTKDKYLNDLDDILTDLKLFNNLYNSNKNKYPLYIPAERVLYSMVKNSISSLWANNVNIAQCYKEFSSLYEKAREQIKDFSYKPLNLNYTYEKEDEFIHLNEQKISLSQTSSGIQSLVPMLVILNASLKDKNENYNKSIIIEEPEISLFPTGQKQLVDYIVDLFHNEPFDIILTTHSPYILSAINNLILAGNVIKEKQNLKKVYEITGQESYIDYDEISIYQVENGSIHNLKNEEFKSINVNAIDNVSDILSEITDQLIDLRYES